MTKYIFITGGVVSSLGKGITAASIGCLLKNSGLKIKMLKIDPYLNVDPGTMSPYQHGEVFVTEDGAETDLDLGHYERFTDTYTSRDSNFTTGVIYDSIIKKERKGEFLGGTVQVIPHVTDEIKSRIKKLASGDNIVIVEIGGTTGDIEGLPFLEAIRQFKQEISEVNVCYIHVTLIPYIRAADEIKTKPTQQSVAKLREIGIEPDILICRTEKKLTEEIKKKIALFCNVKPECVIEEKDVEFSIYEVPLMLQKQNIERLIFSKLKINAEPSKLIAWKKILTKIRNFKDHVTIAVAGKYTQLKDAYKSILEALSHGGLKNNIKVVIRYFDVERDNLKNLKYVNGILVPGGFGDRGIEGKISVINYARVNRIPFFGICLGMQCAVIEFARNVCGLKKANSTEFDNKTPYPVIDLMEEQKNISGKGGTMRLGTYPCKIARNSKTFKAYKKTLIFERHRHRYELNNNYIELLKKHGMLVTGVYEKKQLAEIIELKDHPWFVGTQFHPEFKSTPLNPHPLFVEFIKAAKIRKIK